MKPGRLTALAAASMFSLLAGCASKPLNAPPPIPGPAASVTRAEAIAIAEAYAKMTWLPRQENVFHGTDKSGVRVDTPDTTLATQHGWWSPGKTAVGMPYMWGGFDTPASFTAAIQRGSYAGDIQTPEKRRLLEAAVSQHAAGIDCSGFISRCLRLERSHSTRELPSLCDPIPWDDLRPGDLLNSHNRHVVMFVAWRSNRQKLLVFEAAGVPAWKVSPKLIPRELLTRQNFYPMRYRNLRD